MPSTTGRLLRHVAQRQRLCRIGELFYRSVLVLGVVYAVALLCSRLLAIIPDWFDLYLVGVVPVLAVLSALLLHRSVTPTEAARSVDNKLGAKDLFLTAMQVDSSAGEYQSLVLRRAEERASQTRAAVIRPLNINTKYINHVLLLMLLLSLGSVYLPQFDPFGRNEQRRALADERTKLDEQKKLTIARLSDLKKRPLTAMMSEENTRLLNELKKTFREMKKEDRKKNLSLLNQRQKEIGGKWRKESEKKLNAAVQSGMTQRLGGEGRRRNRQLTRDLQAGRTESARQELSEIRKLANKLAKSDDPLEKQALQSEIGSRLSALRDTLNSQISSPPLDAAMMRALSQLQSACNDNLSCDALKALSESLELSEMELEAMSMSMRDLQALEQALKAIQAARRLNECDLLDSDMCQGCQSIEEYARMYEEMMKSICKCCGGAGCSACNGTGFGSGIGSGMRGAGIGEGGIAPEDPTLETDFKSQRSRSAVTSGKNLLQWKQMGAGESGHVEQDYTKMITQIKQGVSETIIQEQIPPGYHDAIKKYFDSMDAENAETTATQ